MTMQNVTFYSDLIDSLYNNILLRAPDDLGKTQKLNDLAKGTLTVDQLIKSMLSCDEFKHNLSRFFRSYSSLDKLTNDHSQYGEFIEVIKLLVDYGSIHKIVVDVGANGRERSNSYDLLKHFGWKGLLIEANPSLIEAIRTDFRGLDYKLVSVAISNNSGNGFLSLGVNTDISSLDPAATLAWGPITGGVEVRLRRLHEVLKEHDIPHDFDFLSLDIEGFDVVVLNDMIENSLYRPRIICFEGSVGFKTQDLSEVNCSRSVQACYEIVARTWANLILRFNANRKSDLQ